MKLIHRAPIALSGARATRRAGELLKQIEPAPTGPKAELKAGDHLQLRRTDAANWRSV